MENIELLKHLHALCPRAQQDTALLQALSKAQFPRLPKAQSYLDFPLKALSPFDDLCNFSSEMFKQEANTLSDDFFDSIEYKSKNYLKQSAGQVKPSHSAIILDGNTLHCRSDEVDGLVISNLKEASSIYSSAMKARREQLAKDEKDYFALCASCLSPEGVFIYADEGEHEIELVHVVDSVNSVDATSTYRAFLSKIEIFVAPEAKLTLLYRLQQKQISNTKTQTENTISSSVHSLIDCKLEENARFNLYIEAQPTNPSTVRMISVRGNCAKNALFHCEDHSYSSNICRSDFHVVLDGENSDAKVQGVRMLSGQEQFATNLLLEHRAPECTSTQNIRALVDQQGRSIFSGKIFVHQIAQKTDAYQLSKALILSDDALAAHRPNLEIFADDVKASHGATTGALDEEAAFYLSSRGLSKKEAKKMQIEGFIAENVPASFPLIEKMIQRVMDRIDAQVTQITI